MIIVNFGHPITSKQQDQIIQLAGGPIDRIVNVPCQIDMAQPLVPQITAILESAGLTDQEWQQAIINLPALSTSTYLFLHWYVTRFGRWPQVLRIVHSGTMPPEFVVSEILG
jgi:hypothetical protein